MIGSTINRYRVSSKLGEGGMGSVWLAEDPMLGRSVALKILPERFADSPEAKDRLLQEARAASQLHHPGIATVYEAGEQDGQLYLAFEHVDGETVAQRVKREGPLPIDEAVRIAREAAAALGHAHASGILHRDVTSGNVMLDRTGAVKLVDFGLALPETQTRVTRPASAPGTLGYVAPEVVQGKPGDRRSDLYGLGVVLYEMLTGHLPYERDRAEAVLYAVVHEELDPPRKHRKDISQPLESVLIRLLAKDPAKRFANAKELMLALEGGPKSGNEAASYRRPGPRVALVAIATLLLGTFLLWKIYGGSHEHFDSVAILPFTLPGENADELTHLATGLGDGLAGRLSRVPELRVTPWVTSRRYSPDGLPLADIAAELNVESLVVGTLREEGGKLRVTLFLTRAGEETPSWSAEFEDTRLGLLDLQDAICLAVGSEIRGQLTSEEESALVRRSTDRADAWEHYLRGSMAMQSTTRSGGDEAVAHFETALAIDPQLTEAWVGLGAAHNQSYHYGWGGAENLGIAKECFTRALAIEPEALGALRGLIRVFWNMGWNEECLRIASGVRERSGEPGQLSIETLLAQAEGFLFGGLPDEAIPLLLVVNKTDPVNQAGHWFLAVAYNWAGDHQGLLRAAEDYFRNFGEDITLRVLAADSSRCLGDQRAALTHYDQVIELIRGGTQGIPDVYSVIALLSRELSTEAEAAKVAREGILQLESRLAENIDPRLDDELVCLYAIAGDTAKVLELGQRMESTEHLPGSPHHVSFAYALVGETKRANDILAEQAELLRTMESRGASNGGAVKVWGGFPLSRLQEECFAERYHFDRLPAFGDLVRALRQEQERLRALYGG